jgi:hypothetical protein
MKQHPTVVESSTNEGQGIIPPSENELRLGRRVVELEDEREALLVSTSGSSQTRVCLTT